MVYTEYIGARMRYRAERRARRRKHVLTIMRNICGVAAFVFFMLVLGKAGASVCGVAFSDWLNEFFDNGNTITVHGEEYDFWACWELI